MGADIRSGGHLATLVGELLDDAHRRPRHRRLPTGFEPFDEAIGGGLRTGDLTILGGRPGTGKTAVALQWARRAVDDGAVAVVASLEHDPADLLERMLLAEIAELPARRRPPPGQTRRIIAEVLDGQRTWSDALAQVPELGAARDVVETRSEHLHLACGSDLTIEQLRDIARGAANGRPLLVVVDYLQKVSLADGTHDAAAVTRACKSIALELDAAVLAVSSTDRSGLLADRIRLSQLSGAEAIAYEADLAVILDDKLNVVSRLHTAYDETLVREFHDQSVLLVEKHRRGLSGLAFEHRRDLAFSRLNPRGGIVSERLATDVVEVG